MLELEVAAVLDLDVGRNCERASNCMMANGDTSEILSRGRKIGDLQ